MKLNGNGCACSDTPRCRKWHLTRVTSPVSCTSRDNTHVTATVTHPGCNWCGCYTTKPREACWVRGITTVAEGGQEERLARAGCSTLSFCVWTNGSNLWSSSLWVKDSIVLPQITSVTAAASTSVRAKDEVSCYQSGYSFPYTRDVKFGIKIVSDWP